MPKTFKQHFLKDKEAKLLFEEFRATYRIDVQGLLKAKASVQEITSDYVTLYAINGKIAFARHDSRLYPTLLFDEVLSRLPRIVVDMGAIPHVCNGADLMAPGIVRVEGEFSKDSLVLIVDEKYKKPLAIALALIDSQTMAATRQGKTAKNIHHVGDRIWNEAKKAKQ